jgi:hypothetical protein
MISLRFFSPPEKALHPLHRRDAQLQHRQVDALAGRQGLAQELDDRDAGDLLRVLEGEEHAGFGPLVGRPPADVVAAEHDRAGGDLVLGRAHQRRRERALARAVGSHDGVDLAGADGQVEPPQDRFGIRAAGDAGVDDGGRPQSLDPEQLAHDRPVYASHHGIIPMRVVQIPPGGAVPWPNSPTLVSGGHVLTV